MRVIARGWGRDHGEKEIIEGDLDEAKIQTGEFWHSMTEAYLQVRQRGIGKYVLPPKVVISKGAALTLNGKYLVQVELGRSEIARLFYLTHSDRELHELVGLFGQFKQAQEKEEEAQREAAKAAEPKIPRR